MTGEHIADGGETSAEEIAATVAGLAARYSPGMSARAGRQRLERCVRLDASADWLDRRPDELVLEHGNTVAEAREETAAAAGQIRQIASFARSFAIGVPPLADPAKRIAIVRRIIAG